MTNVETDNRPGKSDRLVSVPPDYESVALMPDHRAKPIPGIASTAWILTVTEALLPARRRIAIEEDMSRVSRGNPSWSAAFFGGLLSDIVLTLPENDHWRSLVSRAGSLTAGDEPPEVDATLVTKGPRAGQSFGTYEDCTDLVPLVFADPARDASLAAVADPLSTEAASLIAFAGQGWEAAITAIRAAYVSAVPDAEGDSEVVYPDKFKNAISGNMLFESCADAVRWSVFRRRSYVGPDDPWPIESAYRWAWRADRIILKEPWPIEDVASSIASEAIREERSTEDF